MFLSHRRVSFMGLQVHSFNVLGVCGNCKIVAIVIFCGRLTVLVYWWLYMRVGGMFVLVGDSCSRVLYWQWCLY